MLENLNISRDFMASLLRMYLHFLPGKLLLHSKYKSRESLQVNNNCVSASCLCYVILTYIYIYMHVCAYVCECVWDCVFVWCICIHTYLGMYINIHMNISLCICYIILLYLGGYLGISAKRLWLFWRFFPASQLFKSHLWADLL